MELKRIPAFDEIQSRINFAVAFTLFYVRKKTNNFILPKQKKV
jgi:hypothetical protein